MRNTPEFWNDLFEKGKQFREVDPANFDRILGRVTERAGEPPTTAIEFGCGTGQLTLLAADRDLRVKGLDVSDVALSKARERLNEFPKLREFVRSEQRDFNQLKETGEAERVDVAFMKLTFAFVEDRLSFLNYVRNSLQPNGIFVLMTPVLDGKCKEYTDFGKFISVPLDETEEFIGKTFSSVEVFDRQDHGENGMDVTYLLSNA